MNWATGFDSRFAGMVPIALLGLAFANPAVARAEKTVLARQFRATAVSAYGGRVVWSSWDRRARTYRLVSYDTAQGRQTLPIRPRSVPFDVDLGPGRAGTVAAVYSRCAAEPPDVVPESELPSYTDGHGCDLYRYDFRMRRERRVAARSLPRASEVLPTVWKGRVAFARVYEHRRGIQGLRTHLYHGSLTSRQPPRRLRGGTPGDWEDVNLSPKAPPDYVGGDAPSGLDLAGSRLAFVWGASLEHCAGRDPDDRFAAALSELWVDTVDGREHRRIEDACSGDETDYFATPSFSGTRLFYYRRLNTESYGGRFRAHDSVRRTFIESRAGRRAFSIARDGGTTYYSSHERGGRTLVVRRTGLVFEPSERSRNLR